jgi:hypothetical protein
MMGALRKKITNISGSIYEERIHQKADYYDMMRKTIFA